MTSEDFQTGDPVWAKMKGYPPWPAKVVDPPSASKPPKNKKASYVLFFGTGDYAWILHENIIPHSESVLAEAKNKKKSTATYQNGIDALVSYSKSYKRVKQPKVVKKDKIENNNNVTKSPVRVVKVLNSVSKKYNRKVLSKSLLHKKKKSFCDFNGKSADYSLPKSSKFKSLSPRHFSPIRDLPHFDLYSPFQRSKPVYKAVNSKYIKPSHKTFGFIGLGMMGKQIVKSLLEAGHKISIWNKTSSQCDIFVDMGAKKARYPADLIVNCDITFCCVSDPEASKAVIFGENGVLSGLEQAQILGLSHKGYVEMTSVDPLTSQKICEAVLMKRGVYLEAPLCGTSRDAEEGNLLILAAGDRKLFSDCETCFHAIGKNAYYVSCEVGDGSKMNLILSMFSGTVCAALGEAMVLVERLKFQKSHFLECLKNGPLSCKNIIEKAQKMDELAFQKVTALKYVQKDISLALLMGDQYSQSMPVTAAANEVYKHGKLRNYSNEDMSAVYKVVKY